MELAAEQARAIILQAKTDETYEGPLPEDPEKAIKEAKELVQMAETAWKSHVRGPAVKSILYLAESNVLEDEETVPQVELKKPDKTIDEINEEKARQEAEKILERVENRINWRTTPPFDKYDTLKDVALRQTIRAKHEVADDPHGFLAHVWEYESNNKNRKRILQLIEEEIGNVEDTPSEESGESPGSQEEAPREPIQIPTVFSNGGASDKDSGDSSPEECEHGFRRGSELYEQEDNVDAEYEGMMEEVEDELKRQRLHTPKPPQEDPPELPYDYSKMSDAELHSLHSIFSAFAYYASYQLMKEERSAALCRQAADEIARELFVLRDKYDEKGKEKRVTELEAEVESDPHVIKWRKRQRKHEIFASAHRQERDSYNKLVESLSRLETMRHNDWERTRR